jgi:hypothetical protein
MMIFRGYRRGQVVALPEEKNMRSHFALRRGVAMACAASGATMVLNGVSAGQLAFDSAVDPVYNNGWQVGDNGGFGFAPWSMFGTYTSATQHVLDSGASPHNQLGRAWTLYNPNGPNQGTDNAPSGGTDISQAGRGFPALQVGQTITTVIDNPIQRQFFRGYTVRLNTGGNNTVYAGTAASRLAVGTFEYFTNGRWYISDASATNSTLFDTDSAAGMRIDVALTGANTYQLTMTTLGSPSLSFSKSGTLSGTGAINWIEFELYNTDSDLNPVAIAGPAATDFYIRSIGISNAPIPQLVSAWNVNALGDWHNAANWTHGVPNGINTQAEFHGAITANRTVVSDLALTLARISFANPNTYVLAGAGSLTMQVAGGSAQIVVSQGNQKINLPLIFASDTSVFVAAGAGLNIADPATIKANRIVTKIGNVSFNAPLTIEPGGTLALSGGRTSMFGAPALGAGAVVDVGDGSLTIDYHGQPSPASTIRSLLASGYNGGAWNGSGIHTSSAIPGHTALGWKDDPANQLVLVKYTYYGDANLDGMVDVADLGTLATNWQSLQVWAGGDFDYSGFVNVGDLGLLATNWQAGVGNPLGPEAIAEALASLGLPTAFVPEPAGLGLILFPTAAGLLARRRHAASN